LDQAGISRRLHRVVGKRRDPTAAAS